MSQFLSERPPRKNFLKPELYEVLVHYLESCEDNIMFFEEILSELHPDCFMRRLNWYKSVVERETMMNGVIDYRMGFECCDGNVCVFNYDRRERYCRVFEKPIRKEEVLGWFKLIELGEAEKFVRSEEPSDDENDNVIVFKNFEERISIPGKDVFVILAREQSYAKKKVDKVMEILKNENNLKVYKMIAIKNDWNLDYFTKNYEFPHFTIFRSDSKKPILFESEKSSEFVTVGDILKFIQENSYHSFDCEKFANEVKQFDELETKKLEVSNTISTLNRKIWSIQDVNPEYSHPVSNIIADLYKLLELDSLELNLLTEKFNDFQSIAAQDVEETLSKIIDGKSILIRLEPSDETLEIVKSHPKVILDFSTTWCGPCEYVAPFFGQLSVQYENVVFVKVICDDNKTVLQNFNVEAFPTFQTFVNGDLLEKSIGANSEKLKELVISLNNHKYAISMEE